MSEIADILEKAADLIEPIGAWGGHSCSGDHCAQTAITQVAGPCDDEALSYFREHIGMADGRFAPIWRWNDAPERTQAEVVAKLREAAAKARGGQS